MPHSNTATARTPLTIKDTLLAATLVLSAAFAATHTDDIEKVFDNTAYQKHMETLKTADGNPATMIPEIGL